MRKELKNMNIIGSIYANRVDEPRILSSERKIDEEIFALMKSKGYRRENEEISDLLFEASGCGQEHGFHAGFQTAVSLLLECLAY